VLESFVTFLIFHLVELSLSSSQNSDKNSNTFPTSNFICTSKSSSTPCSSNSISRIPTFLSFRCVITTFFCVQQEVYESRSITLLISNLLTSWTPNLRMDKWELYYVGRAI
jgi:hypothetical protein